MKEAEESYAEAAEFFKKNLGGAPAVFHCESWLLADYHEEMLQKDSGILTFARRYQLVERTPPEGDLWRIFYKDADLSPEDLPEDTALKRGYKKHLTAGNALYGGRGLFLFEKPALPSKENI